MVVGIGVDDRVVASLGPLPALVAVHRVVATTHGRDRGARMDRREPTLEVRDEHERRARWRVPPVEQRVDRDPRHAPAGRQSREGDEMAVVRVNAAWPDQGDEVQDAAGLERSLAGRQEGRAFVEGPVGDRGVDPWQVLEHGPACSQVQVADLGVAHLPGRQTDRFLGRPKRAMWPAFEQPAP